LHEERPDMWKETRHEATQHRGHGRIRAALLTAVAMLAAGIAVAGMSEWLAGDTRSAGVALGGAAVAAFAGWRAFRARGASSSPDRESSVMTRLEELDRRTAVRGAESR